MFLYPNIGVQHAPERHIQRSRITAKPNSAGTASREAMTSLLGRDERLNDRESPSALGDIDAHAGGDQMQIGIVRHRLKVAGTGAL